MFREYEYGINKLIAIKRDNLFRSLQHKNSLMILLCFEEFKNLELKFNA